uniref:1,4-dihydroxy-2-naphthoyl-CoA hydrolase n=1 Tax=Sciadococcus taiwanensis TaxID=3028030 RepID=A0A9Y1I1X8_9RHOD|nr:hypothetical protein SCTW_008 [Sciadococcus taiwanensis]
MVILNQSLYTYHSIIYLEDTDSAGLLYFSRIFQLAHRVFEKFLLQNNTSLYSVISKKEYNLPIVHADVDYLTPLYLSDSIEIKMYIEKVGNSSFSLKYKFIKKDTIAAIAHIVHVAVSKNLGRSIKIPEELLFLLQNN